MCEDGTQWKHWASFYAKHVPPAGLDQDQVVARTAPRGSPSYYLPRVDVREIEAETMRLGVYVSSGKPATVYKVHAFAADIGASEGAPSRWVLVESTSGTFHGRPISLRAYR